MQSRPPIIGLVPNALTVIRLVLGLAFPWIPAPWRLIVLVIAVLTEILDGQIARLLQITSTTGRLLDPIADKVFLSAVLVTLVTEGAVTLGQLLLVMSRDIIVIGGASWVVLRQGPSAVRRMPPSFLGKCATAAQLIFLLTLLFTTYGRQAMFVIASGLSFAAGIDYIRRFR